MRPHSLITYLSISRRTSRNPSILSCSIARWASSSKRSLLTMTANSSLSDSAEGRDWSLNLRLNRKHGERVEGWEITGKDRINFIVFGLSLKEGCSGDRRQKAATGRDRRYHLQLCGAAALDCGDSVAALCGWKAPTRSAHSRALRFAPRKK